MRDTKVTTKDSVVAILRELATYTNSVTMLSMNDQPLIEVPTVGLCLNFPDGSAYVPHEERGWSDAKDALVLGWAYQQLGKLGLIPRLQTPHPEDPDQLYTVIVRPSPETGESYQWYTGALAALQALRSHYRAQKGGETND